MGEVYRAFDERLDRRVALKRIRPDAEADARRRFRREARATARLNHPGIVKVHDLIAEDDGDWLVLELVEGETLDRRLATDPPGPEQVLAFAAELAAALAAAHAEGILHRDLKAGNVLIAPSGQLKILDFGLAKQVVGRDVQSSLSVDGQILGTPHAMSPEQAAGRKVDLRSDLFSLGTLLYEMATGVSPFRADDPVESLTRVCVHRPPPARELAPWVPDALSELIDRLLEKDPAHRPRTAEEVGLALSRVTTRPDDGYDETGADPGSDAFARPTTGRRQVTLACCELVGAEGTSGALDPEALFDVADELEGLARDVAEYFEGHVVNVLGHRLVFCLGYPRSHEDDARRATHAALDLVARFAELDPPRRGLALRIGIHTGPAVVLGNAGGSEQLAPGPTLDLAQAVRGAAESGQVLVSGATRRLIGDVYDLEPLSAAGSPETPELFRIRAAKDLSSQWELAGKLTPLVARRHELEVLLDRWRLAQRGSGQAVLVSGEAGIGKSRLIHTLGQELAPDDPDVLHAACTPYAQSSPFHPFLDLLGRWFDVHPDRPPDEQLDRLEEKLSAFGLPDDPTVPLLAHLLAIPTGNRYPPLRFSPPEQRERTLELLSTLVLETARRRPAVLVVEDLHWADPSSLELIGRMIERAAAATLLLLLTSRLEFESPWDPRAHLTPINLTRLAAPEAAELIERVLGGRALPDEVRAELVAKTDGVPLFVEELTKNLLESGHLVEKEDRYELARPLAKLEIPATLRDSLTARLDRLGTAKPVAQLAAAVGREFTRDVLSAVSPLADALLARELARLVAAELLYSKGFASRRRYLFKHALIQDAARESLLPAQWKYYNEQLAQAYVEKFPDVARTDKGRVARHYEEAEIYDSAVDWRQGAADSALERSANLEALQNVQRALGSLESLPESQDRRYKELTLYLSLGFAQMAVKAWGSPEMEEAYEHAYALCEELDEKAHLFFWALSGLHASYVAQARLSEAAEIGARMLEHTEEDPVRTAMACFTYASSLYFEGQFEIAGEHFEKGMAAYSPDDEYPRAVVYDTGVGNTTFLGLTLWHRGYPDRAVELVGRAFDLARQIDQPFTLGFHLFFAKFLFVFLRDFAEVARRAEELMQFSAKNRILSWQPWAVLHSCWCEILTRDDKAPLVDEWIPRMRKAVDDHVATGNETPKSYCLTLYMEACLEVGLLDEAQVAFDEALEVVEKTGEQLYEPELHRLAGERHLARIGEDPGAKASLRREAETCFRRAIDVASQLDSKSLALRAAVSLSRLLKETGRKTEAHDLLRERFSELTEGFDTPDLAEARAALESME